MPMLRKKDASARRRRRRRRRKEVEVEEQSNRPYAIVEISSFVMN
jgi:hypothetical protein